MKQSNFSFIKTAILPLLFFTLTPLVIGLCIFSLGIVDKPHPVSKVLASETKPQAILQAGVSVFAALPDISPSITTQIGSSDARAEILNQYLKYYSSPLSEYADFIVTTADKYGVDFRLITAIAQQESNLCKYIPPNTYNCWGWGIHSQGTLGFSSFKEGIDVVTAGLKSEYIDKGYTSVDEIMSKYTPSSPGSWAHGVNTFMEDLE